LFSLHKRWLWAGSNSSLPVPGGGSQVSRRQNLSLQSGTGSEDKRQEASFETREVQTGYKEDDLHSEYIQAVWQVVQRWLSSPASDVFKNGEVPELLYY